MEANIVTRAAFGVNGFERMDADYVNGGAVALEERLQQIGGKKVSELVSVPTGGRLDRKEIAPGGTFIYLDIDGVDIEDGLAFADELLFADKPSRAKYRLKAGDILVSNVRPERGALTFITQRLEGAVASSGFTLLRPNDQRTAPALYATLRTTVARCQRVRRNRGSMYPAVLARDILETVVPTLPADLEETLIQEVVAATAEQDSFFTRLGEQQTMINSLLASVGAPPSPLEAADPSLIDAAVIGRRAAIVEDARLDAEFFRSAYPEFHAKLEGEFETFKLGDYFAGKAGRTTSGDALIPTIKQRVLTNAGVNWSAITYEAGNPEKRIVEEDDILLASTAHEIAYVGRKVDVAREMPEEAKSANQAVAEVMVFRARETKPAHLPESFVAAFLRHAAGRHQVQRCIRGLRGGHTYPADLEKHVLLPDPGLEWLAHFEEVTKGAETTRRHAKGVMGGSVQRAEDWISSELEAAASEAGNILATNNGELSITIAK